MFVKEQGEEELLRILEIPDGHRAPAPPQIGSCDQPLLLLEPGNLTSSPSVPLASPQPCGQASHEEPRGAVEELASIPHDKGKLRRPRQSSLPVCLQSLAAPAFFLLANQNLLTPLLFIVVSVVTGSHALGCGACTLGWTPGSQTVEPLGSHSGMQGGARARMCGLAAFTLTKLVLTH